VNKILIFGMREKFKSMLNPVNESIYKAFKDVINHFLIITGLSATFFADFGRISSTLLQTKAGQLLYLNSEALTLQEVDILVTIAMRIITGTVTMVLAYLYYRHKTK
jgi:hypothetical protein